MDGIEAVREIRAIELQRSDNSDPSIIIAMTAHAMDGDKERCIKAGMNDYLAKPVQLNKLAQILAKWLPKKADNITGFTAPQPEQDRDSIPATGATALGDIGSDGAAVLNIETLRGISDDDSAVERALIEELLRQGPKVLARCHMMIDISDSTGLEYWAHTFKGSCRSLGAERAGEMCWQLEACARDSEIDRAGDLLARLEQEWTLLQEEIERVFQIPTRFTESRNAA
jgi:HPt (histidine-containing phosphotransfer) domain-containing protein